MLQTYQTKVKNEIVVRNEDGTSSSLYDYFSVFGAFFGHVERRLFVALYVHNASLTSTKSKFISKYQITARQFNSIQMHLKGKVKATKESLEYAIEITELKNQRSATIDREKKNNKKTKVHKKTHIAVYERCTI
ncbi:hypothetical protein [Aneurinibacillus tyrosinisolvens]|uniref:hypothetical protein n=1 Tax=Aneurinibacillus tyrosinisolvens TaxID=1443435 RepID=UPI0006994492|nr:hypothetical protein [Aneurinibacillus tyrosinisolvens]